MNRFISVLIVGAFALSGAAFAQTQAAKTADNTQTTQQAKAQPAKPVHGPDEVICKRQGDTESRLGGTKVCHTRAEWDEMSRIARDEVDRSQNTVRNPY